MRIDRHELFIEFFIIIYFFKNFFFLSIHLLLTFHYVFISNSQLVEYVAICLIKIVEQVSQSSDMLDELCKNALIGQIVHLLDLNSRTTVSRPIYNVGKIF